MLETFRAGGFDLAERELERYEALGQGERESPDQVTLEPDELPHRLLSPVDIDAAQIETWPAPPPSTGSPAGP